MGTTPTNPDWTEVPFTVGDRLLAENTAGEVAGIREDVKDMKKTLETAIQNHADRLKSLETDKIKRDDRSRRKMSVLKIASLVGGLVLVILGVAHAVHIL